MTKMLGIFAAIALGAVVLIYLFVIQRNTNMIATQPLLTPAQYEAQFERPNRLHFLLDVRTPEEFATGHIPGAANISVQTLAQRLHEVPQQMPVVVYCRSGNRSRTATQILQRASYSEVYDLGGIIDWRAQGLPVQ
jgi:rhodanese-related sulfurtransferase